MADNERSDVNEARSRRVDIELFIVHPTMTPAEILCIGARSAVGTSWWRSRKDAEGNILLQGSSRIPGGGTASATSLRTNGSPTR